VKAFARCRYHHSVSSHFYSASAYLAMQSARLASTVDPSICSSVRRFVWPSVTRWRCVKMTHATIMRSSLEDSPMTSFFTTPKGNGSGGAK